MAEIDLKLTKFGDPPVWTVVNVTDTFLLPNDGKVKVYVENSGNQNPLTAKVLEQRECNYGHPKVDFTFSCPNGGVVSRMGTFRKDRYNRADGKIAVQFTPSWTGTVRAYGVYDVPEDGRV